MVDFARTILMVNVLSCVENFINLCCWPSITELRLFCLVQSGLDVKNFKIMAAARTYVLPICPAN